MMALQDLRKKSLADLEALWQSQPLGPAPLGRFRGTFLRWIDSAGARKLMVRAFDYPLFVVSPFGVDFDDRRWWFVHPRLRIGRFDVQPGRSRFRDTEAHQLHYGPSRLPGPFKRMLYDEVKQVTGSLVLGLGAMNAERGQGDHFFFALERLAG